MLPDFRVVTIAVVSTFLFAVSAGFYTSSRLANERKPRPETLAAIEENPLNRIALNWPEPVQPAQDAFALDFAVAAQGLRNPVRDVTDEIAAAPEPKVAAAPQVVDAPAPEAPAIAAPVVEPHIEAPQIEAAKPDVSKPEASKPEIVEADPQPVEAVPAPVAAAAQPEDDIPTAGIAALPPAEAQGVLPQADAPEAQAEPEAPAERIAARPEPAADDAAEVAKPIEAKPAAAAPAKKPAKKKAAKKRRPIVRLQPRIAASPAPAPSFSLFGTRR